MDFDTTFDSEYPVLVRYCRRLTDDDDTAHDIAQESLVRLFDHGVDAPPAAIRAWLFTTATRLVRDAYRVRKNRIRLLAEHPPESHAPGTPEQSLEREEARRSAREALDALPDRDRDILLMKYSGFSYREIAEATGVAAASVGTLLARAERRFAGVWTAAGNEP